MAPALGHGRLADAINAGLQGVADELLRPGPPAALSAFARNQMNYIGVAIALLVVVAAGLRWQRQRASRLVGPTITHPPDSRSPAIVGALLSGRLGPHLVDATIFWLGSRGVLKMRSREPYRTWVRVVEPDGARDETELQILKRIDLGRGPRAFAPGDVLYLAHAEWRDELPSLRRELGERGWFRAGRVPQSLAPYLGAGITTLLAGAAVTVSFITGQALGLIATGSLVAAAAVCLLVARATGETTAEGERAVAPWRGYLAGIRRAVRSGDQFDLDLAMIYMTAAGSLPSIRERMKAADAAGKRPAWMSIRSHSPVGGYMGSSPDAYRRAGSYSGGSAPGSGASSGGGGVGGSF